MQGVGLKTYADGSERIAKANTLVDLLEGKSVRDVVDLPRRSGRRWMYNSGRKDGSDGSD